MDSGLPCSFYDALWSVLTRMMQEDLARILTIAVHLN